LRTRVQTELEYAALANELSRQVAHDFSNFIFNLLLHIEIWEKSANPQQTDWDQLKREGKHMASLLRQWEHFHSRLLAEQPTEIDLHELIRQVAGDAELEGRQLQLTPSISANALSIQGCRNEVKHLLRLLLEDAFQRCRTEPTVSIQTETANGKAVVRIEAHSSEPRFEEASTTSTDGRPSSLVLATCRSLAVRLGATIGRETAESGPCVAAVEFPLD
jgi:hypothetical protein